MTTKISLEERFWARVEVAGSDDCWEWRGPRFPKGYGIFSMRGRTWNAHRAGWVLFRGEIGDGLVVCHRCDNRGCVNPNHLFLGTQQENIADMVAKGRQRGDHRPGDKCPTAKLSEDQAIEIKRRALAGESQKALAREFGLKQPTVSNIKTGKTWGHLS